MKPIHNFLNGTWLGHPIHAVLTDVPIGAFTVVIILDVLNERYAADVALVFGILAMLGAALAGFADYADTDGLPRQRATVHSVVMIVALVVYVISALLRWGNPLDRTAPIATSIVAYLSCSRSAPTSAATSCTASATWSTATRGGAAARNGSRSRSPASLADGVPTKAKFGAQTLVLVKPATRSRRSMRRAPTPAGPCPKARSSTAASSARGTARDSSSRPAT